MLGFAILFHLPKAARQRDREGRPAAGGAQVTAAAPGAARGSAEPCPRPQPPPHNGAGPALRHFVGASSPGWAAAAAGTAVRPLPAPPAAHLRRARPAALPPPARPPAAAAPQASPGGSPRRHPGPSLPPAAAKGDVPRPPSRHFVFPSASMDGRRASRPEALSSPCPGRPAATSPLWGRGPARTPPSGPAPPPPPGRAPTSPAFSPPPPQPLTLVQLGHGGGRVLEEVPQLLLLVLGLRRRLVLQLRRQRLLLLGLGETLPLPLAEPVLGPVLLDLRLSFLLLVLHPPAGSATSPPPRRPGSAERPHYPFFFLLLRRPGPTSPPCRRAQPARPSVPNTLNDGAAPSAIKARRNRPGTRSRSTPPRSAVGRPCPGTAGLNGGAARHWFSRTSIRHYVTGGRGRAADGSCRHRLVRRRCQPRGAGALPSPAASALPRHSPWREARPRGGPARRRPSPPLASSRRVRAPAEGLRRRCDCAVRAGRFCCSCHIDGGAG